MKALKHSSDMPFVSSNRKRPAVEEGEPIIFSIDSAEYLALSELMAESAACDVVPIRLDEDRTLSERTVLNCRAREFKLRADRNLYLMAKSLATNSKVQASRDAWLLCNPKKNVTDLIDEVFKMGAAGRLKAPGIEIKSSRERVDSKEKVRAWPAGRSERNTFSEGH